MNAPRRSGIGGGARPETGATTATDIGRGGKPLADRRLFVDLTTVSSWEDIEPDGWPTVFDDDGPTTDDLPEMPDTDPDDPPQQSDAFAEPAARGALRPRPRLVFALSGTSVDWEVVLPPPLDEHHAGLLDEEHERWDRIAAVLASCHGQALVAPSLIEVYAQLAVMQGFELAAAFPSATAGASAVSRYRSVAVGMTSGIVPLEFFWWKRWDDRAELRFAADMVRELRSAGQEEPYGDLSKKVRKGLTTAMSKKEREDFNRRTKASLVQDVLEAAAAKPHVTRRHRDRWPLTSREELSRDLVGTVDLEGATPLLVLALLGSLDSSTGSGS